MYFFNSVNLFYNFPYSVKKYENCKSTKYETDQNWKMNKCKIITEYDHALSFKKYKYKIRSIFLQKYKLGNQYYVQKSSDVKFTKWNVNYCHRWVKYKFNIEY